MSANTIQEFLSQQSLAVVGVSEDRSKYGYKVYKDLKRKGYQVTAVNPNCEAIEGDPCYPNLQDLKGSAEGAVMVVPPKVTEASVRDAYTAGIKYVWMQPGAESGEAVNYCEDKGMACIEGKCIMVESE